MLEMKITITAADLVAAINNLAAALEGQNPHTVCNQFGGDNKHIDNVGTINMGVGKAQPATPTAPVNPTSAPVATPAQAPGAPLSATPAQTATPIVPTVPVAAPAPAVAPVAVSPANAVPTGTVPTAAPQYTIDMLATAGSSLIDAGKMDRLMGLLGKFGVASLTEIKPENYGAVATELRALGAQI